MIHTMHISTTFEKHNSEGDCARDRHVATKGKWARWPVQLGIFSWKNKTTFFLLKQTSGWPPEVWKNEEKNFILLNDANAEVIQSFEIYNISSNKVCLFLNMATLFKAILVCLSYNLKHEISLTKCIVHISTVKYIYMYMPFSCLILLYQASIFSLLISNFKNERNYKIELLCNFCFELFFLSSCMGHNNFP